jgi:hypothetical protein
MKWVADASGRFDYRPHYEQAELDGECELLVSKFLVARHGTICFPISTDDLSVMIEHDTSDLDMYADLSREGDDVDGMTEFFHRRKPAVKIANRLSVDGIRISCLRTTLAHEYGHVKFHSFLWDMVPSGKPSKTIWDKISIERRKYDRVRARIGPPLEADPVGTVDARKTAMNCARRDSERWSRCRRTGMLDAPESDWMEWQASYVSGAILMPASVVRNLIRKGTATEDGKLLPTGSGAADDLAARISEAFDVSTLAARVRLTRLGILQADDI